MKRLYSIQNLPYKVIGLSVPWKACDQVSWIAIYGHWIVSVVNSYTWSLDCQCCGSMCQSFTKWSWLFDDKWWYHRNIAPKDWLSCPKQFSLKITCSLTKPHLHHYRYLLRRKGWWVSFACRLEQCEESFLLKETQLLELPHIPQLNSWVDWSNVGKALAQGNNNKQDHLGIKPESSGSQANPKLLHAAAPLKGSPTL